MEFPFLSDSVAALILGIKIAALAMTMTFFAMALIILSTKLLMRLGQKPVLESQATARAMEITPKVRVKPLPPGHLALISAAIASFYQEREKKLDTHLPTYSTKHRIINPWKYSSKVRMMRGRYG